MKTETISAEAKDHEGVLILQWNGFGSTSRDEDDGKRLADFLWNTAFEETLRTMISDLCVRLNLEIKEDE